MRIFSLLTAILVSAALYLLVFERPALTAFALGETVPPAEQDAATPAATDTVRRVAVLVQKSAAQTVDSAVLVRGRTEAARQVDVKAETSGLIVSEPLRRGAYVTAGQKLCQLDPGTRVAALGETEAKLEEARARVPEAEARLSEAQARLNEAQINATAADKLSKDGYASDARVAAMNAALQSALAQAQSAAAGVQAASSGIRSAEARLAAAQTEIDHLTLTAPFEGLLETDTAELGTLLQPGALCATIIQLDPIKLVGFVPETDVDKVVVGAMAGARLASGRNTVGRVTFLSRSADPATRTFRAEVTVPNTDLSIRDGQTVEIIIAAEGNRAHLLPASALTLDDEGRLGVRVVDADSKALFVPVSVLRDTTEGVWLAGLPDTAEVIVVGQEFVIDGVPVAVTYRETGQ